MNCQRALELLLDAEPSELALAGATPLVEHLRGCAKCSTVAGRFAAQAQAMVVVAARPRVRSRRVPAIGLAAAAGILVAIGFVRSGTASVEPAVTETIVAAPRIAAPVVEKRITPAPKSKSRLVQVHAIAEVATAMSSEAAVASIAVERNTEPSRGVSVAPPAGTRATVFTTRDPGITIVWLQTDDSVRTPR